MAEITRKLLRRHFSNTFRIEETDTNSFEIIQYWSSGHQAKIYVHGIEQLEELQALLKSVLASAPAAS
jgi:hypothetical protein